MQKSRFEYIGLFLFIKRENVLKIENNASMITKSPFYDNV